MTFKKKYIAKGLDTTKQIGGFLGAGNHTVTITQVNDLETTLRVNFESEFGDKFSDSIFVAGQAGNNYSQKLADLLTCLPTDVMQRIVEEDNFHLLEQQKVRVRIVRSAGNYIQRRGVEYIIIGEEGNPPYSTYQAARARLDTLGNKAYLRVGKYMPLEKVEVKGVW